MEFEERKRTLNQLIAEKKDAMDSITKLRTDSIHLTAGYMIINLIANLLLSLFVSATGFILLAVTCTISACYFATCSILYLSASNKFKAADSKLLTFLQTEYPGPGFDPVI
jgi:hypothetical protein